MQLFALDNGQPLLASHAEKQKNYLCPECQAPVRLRRGSERQPHFFHLSSHPHCHQHQKSYTHIQIQLKLLSQISEARLEVPFKEISRIADVAWEKRKIVFEIQCSPISFEEAEGRTADYARLGYQVVWILHDRRFNHRKVSTAEHFLRDRGAYFTNLSPNGLGHIYDQFDACLQGQRIVRSRSIPVDLAQPLSKNDLPRHKEMPDILSKRLAIGGHYFQGDLLARFDPSAPLTQWMRQMEKEHTQLPPSQWKKRYFALLDFFLKKLCKTN